MGCIRLLLVFVGLIQYGKSATDIKNQQTAKYVKEAIIEGQNLFVKYYGSNFEKMVEMYAPNAVMFEPNGEKYVGREEIAEAIRIVLQEGNTLVVRTLDVIYTGGNKGIWRGQYKLTDDGKIVDIGKNLQTWVNINHTWFIEEDTWNSDIPFGWKTHDNWVLSEQIIKRLRDWADAVESGEWERVSSFYTRDYVNMPEGLEEIIFKEGTGKLLTDKQLRRDDGKIRIQFRDDYEVKEVGPGLVTVRGTIMLHVDHYTVRRYLHVMKQLPNEKWYFHVSMWTE